MKPIQLLTSLLPLAGLALAGPAHPGPPRDPEIAAAKQLDALSKEYQKNVHNIVKNRKTGCTSKNILRRKEWSSLKRHEKQAFISAIYCIAAKSPPLSPPSLVPGARSRYDDYTASHQLRTPFVHNNGVFLAYHRHLVATWERALRTECGYKYAQPYWDWTLSYKDVALSPAFDGSPLSLSGDGVFIPNRTTVVVTLPDNSTLSLEPGTGGGCVTSGPFTPDKYTVNLGPGDSLSYNPRCLNRDFQRNDGLYTKPSDVLDLFTSCGDDLNCFNNKLDVPGSGVHGAGHTQLGGVGGVVGDVFVSPADPAFWLHHSMVDRVWAMWQFLGKKEDKRWERVAGPVTNFNVPPSPNVTHATPVDFGGVIAPTKRLGDILSPIDGEHCYVYE